MKTPIRKVILTAFSGALLLGAVSFGLSKGFSNVQKTGQVLAASSLPGSTYTNHDGDTYYSSIGADLTGTKLLDALNSLNSSKRKTTVGYSGMGTTPSGLFRYTDYDPNTVQYDSNNQPYGTKLLTFYSATSASSGMNREHVWPKSHGGNSVENDIHMPRPTLEKENGSRQNEFYVTGQTGGNKGWDPAMESFGLESYRGDSARIIFYCAIANKNLSLTELAYHYSTNDNRDNMMGKLSHMLQWNIDNPVTERERNRNEGAEYLQGNRNPFIDHPEYACKIWGNANEETKKVCKSQVQEVTLDYITASGSFKKEYTEGDTFDPTGIIVIATYTDGSTKDVTSSVRWSPTTLSVGTTQVVGTYTENGVSRTVTLKTLTVHPAGQEEEDVTNVIVTPNEANLKVGESIKLDVIVLPNNAVNKKVVYSSNHSDIASVDTNGNVTANAIGTAEITVKSMQNAEIFAKCRITVTKASDAKIERIIVTTEPLKTRYYVGQEFNPYGIIVEAEYDDNSTEIITNKVSYEVNTTVPNQTAPVDVKYRDFSARFFIEVVVGEPDAEEKAVDYTYEFSETMDKYMMDISEVTETSWQIVGSKYETLDNETKEIFRTATYLVEKKHSTKALTNDEIIDCVKTYDKVLIEKPDFDNFMGRNIGPSNPTFDTGNLILILCLIGFGLLVVIIVAIVIPVAIHKKHKKTKTRI